ncbi:uncharacterized protein L969DRAFT_93872 [Mixia osmundae IAM 14324]|uniref:Acyl-protein thioesterase 1 n=1 Tax=Mixia osmundae (strain CBS 9802 / IAM 14324 / JCM 22182 / KY 12970) TaxID=764103 RepID=G7E9U1_MIXOS|nr:uncharacterized protein L969DRAFT_93872 [Mixia osmundae IAM 14324]KEI40043.1 hypothetical protein L969DRAFT_93872 [Mixia osmundae IAM 14324]GAA99410.1 hypothetical protein E5Q_06108 [Mixia osmundae IAM 14324]
MAKPLIVNARGKHTASVIFSHGLGDSAEGWSFLAQELGSKLPHIRWIFTNAPIQPVTLNFGQSMPSWYDIKSLSPDVRESTGTQKPSDEDERGMLQSVSHINSLVTQEVDAGVPSNRIVCGGFSQGGVISVLTMLTSERKLAGLCALSCYLPLRYKVKSMMTDHARSTPVFWGHGTADPVVRYSWGSASVDYLRDQLKLKHIQFESYPGMAHSANPKELKDVYEWLQRVVPAEGDAKF